MPIAYPAGQDRNFPIFPYYTYVGGTQADKLMREADLGKPWTGPELVAGAEKIEMMAKSGLYAKGPLGIKEPDAIQIFATGKVGDVLGRAVDAPLDPCGAAAGLRPGHLPVPRRGGRRPEAGAELGRHHADGERAEQASGSRVRDDQGASPAPGARSSTRRTSGCRRTGRSAPDAIAYQMQSLKDPLYPEFLKLQPTGTTRVIFTPAVEEAMTQGMQALITGQKTPKAVMESVEAASQKAGERKFTAG